MRYFFDPATLCFDRKENEVEIASWTEEVIVEEARVSGPSYDDEPEPEGGWLSTPAVKETVEHHAYTKVMSDEEFFSQHSELQSATELTEAEFYGFIDSFNSGGSKDLTADENGRPAFVVRPAFVETVESILSKRLAAYTRESDPLKNEAEYDALLNGTHPDYDAWMAKVLEIKQRYPLPK